MRISSVSIAIVLLLLTFAGGCVRNAFPIFKDDQVTTNDAIVGKWVASDGGASVEIQPAKDSRYKVTFTNEQGHKGYFQLRLGKIGQVDAGEITSDAFNPDRSDEFKALLLPLYTLIVIEKASPKQVVINGISVDWFEKYLKAHPDELSVMRVADQGGIVNSSTEDFQAFFKKHAGDPGMLGESMKLVRPGDPTTKPAKP